MKNCTINVTTADTNDDEMPPLGTGGNVGLFRMRFWGGKRGNEGLDEHSPASSQGRHRQEMGPSWFSLGDAPIIIKSLDLGDSGDVQAPLLPPTQPKDSS